MPRIFVGVSSNVDREANIGAALDVLNSALEKFVVSRVYATAASGTGVGEYFNLVVAGENNDSPHAIYDWLKDVESDFGRKRGGAEVSLDLDLLLYGDVITSNELFSIPHSDITRFAYVLFPICEIAPREVHPTLGVSYEDLWDRFEDKRALGVDVSSRFKRSVFN